VLRRSGIEPTPSLRLTWDRWKNHAKDFYQYSAPLVVYAFAGFLTAIAERWLLQRFAGSAEQGFYGLSFRIGTICFMFTGALTPLLMREFSRAFGDKNSEQIRYLFQRYIPCLYTLSAYFAIFVAVQANKVSHILGGSEFEGAGLAICIMAFYPLHRTYGQLSGSLFYATDRTRLYRNIGIVSMAFSLPLTYFLIGPKTGWGLDLGSTGLAIKMVLFQFVVVNTHLWYNTRYLQISFRKFLFHQCFVAVALFAGAWLVRDLIDRYLDNLWIAFFVSGVVYTIVCALLVAICPFLVFMSYSELKDYVRRFMGRLKRFISEWIERINQRQSGS